MAYNPDPIDISTVTLSQDIMDLTESLAENSHDVWAQQRIKDGWTYGENRDDANKEHPDLVPYNQLPESEKEYDRQTALSTLKAIVCLGYRIVK